MVMSNYEASVMVRMHRRIIKVQTGCWLWTGATCPAGYARTVAFQRAAYAHRLMYEARFGHIDHGLEVDHLCYVPGCVNPDHLEAVTPAENTRRAVVHRKTHPSLNKRKPARFCSLRTHCRRGHLLTTHAYITPRGSRSCRACVKLTNGSHIPTRQEMMAHKKDLEDWASV